MLEIRKTNSAELEQYLQKPNSPALYDIPGGGFLLLPKQPQACQVEVEHTKQRETVVIQAALQDVLRQAIVSLDLQPCSEAHQQLQSGDLRHEEKQRDISFVKSNHDLK